MKNHLIHKKKPYLITNRFSVTYDKYSVIDIVTDNTTLY